MSINREEVSIRLGVDASQVSNGMRGVQFTIENTLHHTLRGIKHLLGFNLVGMAEQVLEQILPSAEDFWNRVYGVDEKGTKAQEEAVKRIRTIRDELIKSQKEIEKANYDSSRDSEKVAKTREKILEVEKKLSKEKDKLTIASRQLEGEQPSLLQRLGIVSLEDLIIKQKEKQQARTFKIAETQTAINKLVAEQVKLEKELSDVQKNSPRAETNPDLRRKLDRTKEIEELRQQIRVAAINGKPYDMIKARDAIGRIMAERDAEPGLPAGVSANAFINSTQPYKSYIPSGANNAKAIEQAFSDALKSNTLYVIIKDVEE